MITPIYLTKETFLSKIAKKTYWVGQRSRWDYIKFVVGIVREISPSMILEIGSNGIPITNISDTMDITTGLNPTFLHNAAVAPWPIPNKKYDVVIALQVFEHLDVKKVLQKTAFQEARRTSGNVILSLPYLWKIKATDCHFCIDDNVVMKWASGLEPDKTILVKSRNRKGGFVQRKIYWWKNIK